MDDALLVGAGQRGRHRRHGRHHLPRAQPAPPRQQRRQAASLEQVEDQRDAGRTPTARLVHHLVQPDQVRVVECAEQRRLTGLALGVAGDEDLDRHGRPTRPRHRPPHLPRSATAEQAVEPVAGDERRHRAGGPVVGPLVGAVGGGCVGVPGGRHSRHGRARGGPAAPAVHR